MKILDIIYIIYYSLCFITIMYFAIEPIIEKGIDYRRRKKAWRSKKKIKE